MIWPNKHTQFGPLRYGSFILWNNNIRQSHYQSNSRYVASKLWLTQERQHAQSCMCLVEKNSATPGSGVTGLYRQCISNLTLFIWNENTDKGNRLQATTTVKQDRELEFSGCRRIRWDGRTVSLENTLSCSPLPCHSNMTWRIKAAGQLTNTSVVWWDRWPVWDAAKSLWKLVYWIFT